jgi:hypothetical protein
MSDQTQDSGTTNITPGSQFCSGCGSQLVLSAVICPNCGTARNTQSPSAKSKTASVLLAVFLSFWTWLYTYKRDNWKFWTSLVIATFCFLFGFATLGFTDFLLIGIWIWAVVDVSARPDTFYQKFPNA